MNPKIHFYNILVVKLYTPYDSNVKIMVKFSNFIKVTIILQCFLQKGCSFAQSADEENVFTAQEKSALDKFRPLVSEYQVQDYMKTDLYLLRWLKAGNLNVDTAVELMKKSNRWRQENKIDELIKEDLRAHYKYLPYSIDRLDRKGHPILFVQFGKWEIRKYVLAGKRDFVLRYWWHLTERMEQRVYETAKTSGKPISKFYLLSNIDGFTLTQHACLQCLPLYTAIPGSHDPNHPYSLTNVTFINLPRIAQPALTLIKTALRGQPTLDLVKSYSHDKAEWGSALLKDIAPEQIPPSLGVTEK